MAGIKTCSGRHVLAPHPLGVEPGCLAVGPAESLAVGPGAAKGTEVIWGWDKDTGRHVGQVLQEASVRQSLQKVHGLKLCAVRSGVAQRILKGPN